MKLESQTANYQQSNNLRDRLIEELQKTDNPLVLEQIQAVLDEKEVLNQIGHLPLVQKLIRERESEDHEVCTQVNLGQNSQLARYEMAVASGIFYLATLSLLLIGVLVTAYTEEQPSPTLLAWLSWLGGGLAGIYLLFFIDASVVFYLSRRENRRIAPTQRNRRLLSLLFPPLRIGAREVFQDKYCWLPGWRWCKVNEGLFTELKRRFVLPMIGIALLIIPVLIIEWKFIDETRRAFPNLRVELILESVQTFIWCAFTFEFILMISVSRRKLSYAKNNWIDLLIILLPFISFLRTLRISQIARLKYATRSFKLRGVVTKARQGLIFVDFVQRIFRLRPENEVRRLFRLLQENHRDREELQQKLKEAVQLVERKNRRKQSN
ncbi:MAG: hypothetical protein AAF632_02450 [Bacteroidota bacterium]